MYNISSDNWCFFCVVCLFAYRRSDDARKAAHENEISVLTYSSLYHMCSISVIMVDQNSNELLYEDKEQKHSNFTLGQLLRWTLKNK